MKRTLAFVATVTLAARAGACTVCFGAPGSEKLMDGAGKAIWFMLGVVTFILGCFAWFFVSLALRARRPMEPHEQLIESMNEQEATHA
jgi:hypothetical protein